jgi:hypothetical protein
MDKLMKRSSWLLLLLFVLCCHYLLPRALYAAAPTNLVVGQIGVHEDPSGSATVDQISAPGISFTALTTTAPNYGFTASTYWLRIPVQNLQPLAATFYLDIKNPLLDYVTLYVVNDNRVVATSQSGAKTPSRLRPYSAPTLVLPFSVEAHASATLYLYLRSDGEALHAPFALLDEAELQATVLDNWLLNSALLSILAAMFFYNLLLFVFFRARLYLYYILYLLFGSFGLAALGGFGPAYLYPGNSWLGSNGLLVAAGISLALLIMLMREFLGTPQYRGLDRWAQIFIGCALLMSIGALIWPMRVSYIILTLMTLIYPSFCFLVGVTALRRGHTEARLFIVRQIFSWLAITLSGLMGAGLLAYHPLIFQSPALGAVADAILLSLALGDRIRLLQRDRIAAEEQARRNLEIRSEELARLVAARTAEIKTLHGILPICANCKKIRTEEGAWQQLETYISHHTDAEFSHGICADCMTKLYPQFSMPRKAGAS